MGKNIPKDEIDDDFASVLGMMSQKESKPEKKETENVDKDILEQINENTAKIFQLLDELSNMKKENDKLREVIDNLKAESGQGENSLIEGGKIQFSKLPPIIKSKRGEKTSKIAPTSIAFTEEEKQKMDNLSNIYGCSISTIIRRTINCLE